MNEKSQLSVVIPAYNEAQRIGRTLEAVVAFFDAMKTACDIVVVSDGSIDSTEDIVNSYASANKSIRLLAYQPNKGKGCAVRTGVLQARATDVLIIDADLATPIEDFLELRQAAEKGSKIVIGSRALAHSRVEGWRPWYRVLSGKVFNKIVRALSVRGIHDTQCGFKLFTGGSARRIFSLSRIDGFGFDVEALYLAQKFGYSIAEVPVRWHNSPATKVSVLRDTLPMLMEVMKVRLNDWNKRYDRAED